MSVKKPALTLLLLFLCVGCQRKIGVNPDESNSGRVSSSPVIKDYLNRKVASKGFGGSAYCAYEILDAEKLGDSEKLYLWAVCQEYYRKGQKLEAGTGSSFPITLTIRKENDNAEVLSHQKPGDGSHYRPDLEAMFSKKALESASSVNNGPLAKLFKAVKQEAGVP